MKLILIFIGGGAGSVMRYLLSHLCNKFTINICNYFTNLSSPPLEEVGWGPLISALGGFPVGTFLCNVLGCFLIGMFNSLAGTMGWGSDVRLMLTVGLCGGFTTFSTFSNEGMAMLSSGNYMMYAAYVALSVIIGLFAVFIGANVFS